MANRLEVLSEYIEDKASTLGKINENMKTVPLDNVNTGFESLINITLVVDSFGEINTALNNIRSFAEKTVTLMNSYVEALVAADKQGATEASKISTPSVSSSSGSGKIDPSTEGSDGGLTNNSNLDPGVVDAIEGATPAEVTALFNALNDLAAANDVTLDELLSNPDYADQVAAAINNLANGSSLALAISNMDNPQAVLNSLINNGGAEGFVIGDPLKVDETLKYLEKIANEKGITLQELLTNPKYSEILKEALQQLKKDNPELSTFIDSILSQSSPQVILLSLLNNEYSKIGSTEDIKTTLDYLEKIAKENGITLEQLLTDPKYSDLLKTSLEKLKTENPNLTDLIDNILSEGNPQLALFCIMNNGNATTATAKQIETTLDYLEKIANENGITLEQLLTDPKYSNLLKEALENLKKENPELEKLVDLLLSQEDLQKSLAILISGAVLTTPEAINVLKSYLESIAKENGITLEQLLTDPKYSEILASALVKFSGLYPILAGLTSASPEVIQALLNEILKGNYPNVFGLNGLTVNGVMEYLELIARKNGITLEQLLTDPKYSVLLKETLEKFDKALPLLKELNALGANELQVRLRSIYNGELIEGIDTEVVDMLREFLDSIAEFNGITTEELLMNPKYADLLKQSMSDFEKIAVFMSNIAKLKENNMIETITSLYEGVNPKALGLTNENITSIYNKINELADKNNISIESLLKDGELLKNNLSTLDDTQILKIIYSNSSKESIQKLINNIYGYEQNIQSANEAQKAVQ